MSVAALPVESERDFESWVVDLAMKVHRWHHVYHSWMSIRSAQGWPDLAMVRGPRLLLAELKSEKGKLSPAQEGWLQALGVVAEHSQGVEVYVWRPSDREEIEEVLR